MGPNSITDVKRSTGGYWIEISVSGQEGTAVIRFNADELMAMHYNHHEMLWIPNSKTEQEPQAVSPNQQG